ncbi:MAG: hypothetical protein HQL03_13575, partial [Nitrospirae bacterium]|nr:hypothetical protein [Nitrospirota bacterium]
SEGLIEGKRDGLLEGIEAILDIKYGSKGLELMDIIRNIDTVEKLSQLKVIIKRSATVDEVRVSFIGMVK